MALSSTTAYLLLTVADTRCALAQAEIREILPLPHLHRPPASGPLLAGFLDLGGMPVAAIDLARLLGLRSKTPSPQDDDPYRHLILSAFSDTALLVDRVEDLLRVPADAIRPVSSAHTLNGCVVAEIAWDDALIPVLAMAQVLTAEETSRVAALAGLEAERLAALAI
ncbi:MAG: chemotaxis protein CheW [Methylobacterium sp.]|nr:chemotaxis protein CheW [Methylobacterium sp.]MBX9930596.1 chemotaxis protein CheW [Methylobacterium sp.]